MRCLVTPNASCRARVQIKKDEEELNRAFGSGPIIRPKAQPYKGPKAPKGTAQLTGPAAPPPAAAGVVAEAGAGAAAEGEEGAEGEEQQPQKLLTTVQIFGDSKQVEKAVAMIEEAVANREQKQKQRQAQYDRKREQKHRDRCGGCGMLGEVQGAGLCYSLHFHVTCVLLVYFLEICSALHSQWRH